MEIVPTYCDKKISRDQKNIYIYISISVLREQPLKSCMDIFAITKATTYQIVAPIFGFFSANISI